MITHYNIEKLLKFVSIYKSVWEDADHIAMYRKENVHHIAVVFDQI